MTNVLPAARFTFTSIAEVGLTLAAEVLARGFADYFVPMVPTVQSLLAMERIDGVDRSLSSVVLRDGEPVGAALVARREDATRVAGMAVVPSAQRGGVARALMEHLLAEARARSDRTMELEVIEQNEPAERLYSSLGFRRVRRLIGHTGRPPHSDQLAALVEIEVDELARVVSTHALPDLPWQLSAATLVQLGPPHVAVRLGPAVALITDPSAATISIRALTTETPARRRGHALRLLESLFARHPDKEWRTSAIWPEDLAPLFVRAGLTRSPLSQWQMTTRLISRDASRSPS